MLSAVLKSMLIPNSKLGSYCRSCTTKRNDRKGRCIKIGSNGLNKIEKSITNTDVISIKIHEGHRFSLYQGEMIFSLEALPFADLLGNLSLSDAIDYTFAQRLSLYLIGYDDFKIKNIALSNWCS